MEISFLLAGKPFKVRAKKFFKPSLVFRAVAEPKEKVVLSNSFCSFVGSHLGAKPNLI